MQGLEQLGSFVFAFYNLIWGGLIGVSLYFLWRRPRRLAFWVAATFLLFVAVSSGLRYLALQETMRLFASQEQTNTAGLAPGPITALYVPDTSEDLRLGRFCNSGFSHCTGTLDNFLQSPDFILETGRGPFLRWQLLIYDDRCSAPPAGAMVRPGPFSSEVTALNVCILVQPINEITARYQLGGSGEHQFVYDSEPLLMTLSDRETGQIVDQSGVMPDQRTVLVLGFLSATGERGYGPYSRRAFSVGHPFVRPLTDVLNQFKWDFSEFRKFEKALRRGAPAPAPSGG